MCFGTSSSTENNQILQQQAQQQQNINTGEQQLQNIFSGGQIGVNPVSAGQALNPSTPYYDALGNSVSGSTESNLYANGQLFSGQQQEQGFTPQFYQDRQNAYLNYADPQVYSQYGQTLGQLNSSLANAGLLNSSAAQNAQTSLGSELNNQLTGQANTAIGQSQQLQQQVGNEQAQLTSQLQASANPAQTSVSALDAASQLSAPSLLQPLGNLFTNWSQLYGANNLQTNYNNIQNQLSQGNTLLNSGANGGQFASLGSNNIWDPNKQ